MINQQTTSFDTALHNGVMNCAKLDRGDTNKRGRDCRRCGGDIPKGTGTLFRYWSNGNAAVTYLCAPCAGETERILEG